MKHFPVWFIVVVAGILGWSSDGFALDHNFAGSAQADYHLAPRQIGRENNNVLDGATLEASFKVSTDLSDHLSSNAKLCIGCHGLETDMLYFDYRPIDELNFRIGRFSPSFGAFNLRHDPSNHRTSDKPLPYDMGRMLRLRDWNMGVLPSPFPDNGVEVNGTHWFGATAQLDYAVYAVSGFKGDHGSTDLDFVQSRSGNLYYVDNNGIPSVGARLGVTFKLSARSDLTLGASGMGGTFDPANQLTYVIAGADVSLRLGQTNLRAEWLVRREQFATDDPTRFRYAIPAQGGDFFVKHGAYLELEQPIVRALDLVVRVDGMYRKGNVLVGSMLDKESAVGRLTFGLGYLVERHLRLKASTELWQFTDAGPTGSVREVSFHLGAVGTF